MARTKPDSSRRAHATLIVAVAVAGVSLGTGVAVGLAGRSRPDPVALASAEARLDAADTRVAGVAGADGEGAEIDLVQQRRVLAALAQVGLDPESLAAAGVTPQEASAIGTALAEGVEGAVAELESASAALLAREQEVGALERLVVSGQASEPQLGQLSPGRAGLAAARAARDQAAEAVWDAAVDAVAPESVARLVHLRDTRDRLAPAHLRALTLEPGGWARLENALTHVRVAEALEIDPEPEAVSAVADAEASPAAISAREWLASNLAAVSSNLALAAGQ